MLNISTTVHSNYSHEKSPLLLSKVISASDVNVCKLIF